MTIVPLVIVPSSHGRKAIYQWFDHHHVTLLILNYCMTPRFPIQFFFLEYLHHTLVLYISNWKIKLFWAASFFSAGRANCYTDLASMPWCESQGSKSITPVQIIVCFLYIYSVSWVMALNSCSQWL